MSPVAGFVLPLAFTYPTHCVKDNPSDALYSCKDVFGIDSLAASKGTSLFVSLVLAAIFFAIYFYGTGGGRTRGG
jgi:hypothetical protein